MLKLFRLFLGWSMGIVSTYYIYRGFMLLAKTIDISDISRSVRSEFDSLALVISIMIGSRIGMGVSRGKIQGGMEPEGNIDYIACLIGISIFLVLSTPINMAFKSYYSVEATVINNFLNISLMGGILWMMLQWRRKALIRLKSRRFKTANPIADAEAALARGDYRFQGVYELSISIPGADERDYDSLKYNFGISEITKKSDYLIIEEQERHILLASMYSEIYNRRIIQSGQIKN